MFGLCGTDQNGADRQQTTDASRTEKAAGVTDGLGLPAHQLISSKKRTETRGLKGRGADEQVGRQTDTQANAPIGRRPESRQTDVQTDGPVSIQGRMETRRCLEGHSDDTA